MDPYIYLQLWHHAAYLVLSFLITVVVGQILYRSGAVFLEDAFAQNPRLAQAINRLLLVGFYLINLGWVSLTLRAALTLDGFSALIERVAQDIGVVLLVLGVMHFLNVAILNVWRKRPDATQSVQPR